MPQVNDAPSEDQFGDRAQGGMDPIKKKKKPTPTVNPAVLEKKVRNQAETVQTEGMKARREAPITTPQTRRAVRERVVNNHIAGYVHDAMDTELKKQLGDSYVSLQEDDQARLIAEVTPNYLEDLNQRAQRLAPGLLRKNPNLAAELIMSQSIPTHQLRDASEAALEAWQGTVSEYALRESNHAAGLGLPNAHDMIAGVRATLKSPIMQGAATMAWNIRDDNQRAIYLSRLRYVHMHPEIYTVDDPATMAIIHKWYSEALDGALVAEMPNVPMSGLESVTAGIGMAAASPFKAAGYVGGSFLRAAGLDDLADYAGAGGRWLEEQGGSAIHFVQGLTATALTTPISAWDIAHGNMPRFLHGWGDHETVMTDVLNTGLEAIGEDPKDWQGFIGFANLAEDFYTAEVLLRIPAEIKLNRTTVNGRSGQAILDSPAGQGLREKIWEDIERSRGRVRRTAEEGDYDTSTARLIADRYKKMQPKMAEDLAKAATKDDVYRILERFIDENPTLTAKVLGKELRSVNRELRRIGKQNQPSPARSALEEIRSIDDELGRLANEGIESGPEVDALIARGREVEAGLPRPQVERLIEIDRRMSEMDQAGNASGLEYDALMNEGRALAEEMDLVRSVNEQASVSAEALQARAIEIKAHLADLRFREPVWELPQRSAIQSFMRGVPSSNRIRGLLQTLFAESGKFDISKLFNDFSPRDGVLYSPVTAKHNPYNWASHNAEGIRKVLNQAKVPAEEIRGLIGEMYKITNDQQFWRWEAEINRAAQHWTLRGGKRSADYIPGFSEEIFRISDRSLEERINSPVVETTTLPDGRVIAEVRNSIETPAGEPLLTRPEHFRNQGQLPDIALVQEANSAIRYFDNWAKQNPWLGKASIGDRSLYGGLRATARLTKFVALDLPRMILKPMILVARIIPMGTKIFVDETMRQHLMGYTRSIWKKNGVDYSLSGLPVNPTTKQILGQMGESIGGESSALGTIVEAEVMNGEIRYHRIDTTSATINDMALVAKTQADQVALLAQSPFMQKFAAYGPEGMLQYLTTHPETRLGTWYKEQYAPYLAEKGITPQQWLEGQARELEQVTGGIKEIHDGIATGEFQVGRPVDTGATIERQHIIDELEIARSERALREDGVVRNEWSARMSRLERDLERMDRSIKFTGRETLKIKDSEAVSNEIMKAWQEQRYKMPEEVIVKESINENPHLKDTMSRADRARVQAGKLSGFIYKGLRPLSKYDFARRNTYRAVLDETYSDLIRRGYNPDLALEIAHVRSAGITKDLHYDLTARSSFDRKMKDLFWFSPVWREQISTWLYKIPSRSYWPVGLVLRAHELYSVMDAFKDIGLLEWKEYEFRDPETGKMRHERTLMMNVPWVTDFIQKAAHNSEVGQMNIEGFNPTTPGTAGLLPTIAPGMESILMLAAAKAPDSMKPFFDVTADLFTFDQDPTKGPSYFPSVMISVAEMMGLNIPFDTLNLDAWRQIENKTNIQSLRWAASDLAADGIMPPEYPGLNDEINNTEKYQKWVEEKDAYNKKLIAHSHDYYWGVGALHTIGSVLAPGQFTRPAGMTDAGKAYYEFMQPLYDAYDAGEMTLDERHARQNEYVREHPEAWIYSVGQHPGVYGTPTYQSDAYLDAKDYTEKALKFTHYWMDVDENAPDTPEGEKAGIAEGKAERAVINRAAEPTIAPNDLENLQLLGLDQALAPIVEEVTHIYHATDQRSVGKSDYQKVQAYIWRDNQLKDIASKYGEDGEEVIRYFRRTPAQRLQDAEYFHSKPSALAVQEAQDLINYSHANSDSDFVGSAETNGVLDRKIALYRRIEDMRASNPAFDRELRRAEETLGEKDTTKGRVSLYEWIFFGNQDDIGGYQNSIVRGLNG